MRKSQQPAPGNSPLRRACHNLAVAHLWCWQGGSALSKAVAALCKTRSEFALMLYPTVCESERQHT